VGGGSPPPIFFNIQLYKETTMLCDEIVLRGINGITVDMRPMIKRIAAAPKFVLANDFATVADGFSQDFSALTRVMPWCRLPFNEVWFEVAQADRPSFLTAPTHAPLFQTAPSRVGVLLTATRPDYSAWNAHLFWSVQIGLSAAQMKIRYDMLHKIHSECEIWDLSNKPEPTLTPFVNIDTTHPGWLKASVDVRKVMASHVCPDMADYGFERAPPGIIEDEWYKLITDLARADWAGEVAYWFSVIGLLNARNVAENETVDNTKHNRLRAKHGKRPLASHTIVKISQRLHGLMRQASGGKNENLPAHMVRGHFKRRRTGIFFWHPHMRGDPSKGHTTKTYQMTS
jgi:hypothetical protein